MTFTWSINSISYTEPTLLLTVALASVLCWFVGARLPRVARRATTPWRGVLYLVPLSLFTLIVALVGPVVILSVLYSLVHGWNNQVCVAFVMPALAIPALVVIVSAIREIYSSRPAV